MADKESFEAMLARIDERTAKMETKLDDHCKWKTEASIDIGILNQANLPPRVSKLEEWTKYRDGAIAILLILVTSGRVLDFLNLLTGR
jgi:hypothetical protein